MHEGAAFDMRFKFRFARRHTTRVGWRENDRKLWSVARRVVKIESSYPRSLVKAYAERKDVLYFGRAVMT